MFWRQIAKDSMRFMKWLTHCWSFTLQPLMPPSAAREAWYACLRDIGIDAQLAGLGRPEEAIPPNPSYNSAGVVKVKNGKIRWVNFRRETIAHSNGDIYWVDYAHYGVPDPRMESGTERIRIKSVGVKKIPIIGQVVDVHWEGDDWGLGIINRLNRDSATKIPIRKRSWVLAAMMTSLYGGYGPKQHEVEMSVHPGTHCWILSTAAEPAPSRKLWDCFESIAKHLVATSN